MRQTDNRQPVQNMDFICIAGRRPGPIGADKIFDAKAETAMFEQIHR